MPKFEMDARVVAGEHGSSVVCAGSLDKMLAQRNGQGMRDGKWHEPKEVTPLPLVSPPSVLCLDPGSAWIMPELKLGAPAVVRTDGGMAGALDAVLAPQLRGATPAASLKLVLGRRSREERRALCQAHVAYVKAMPGLGSRRVKLEV